MMEKIIDLETTDISAMTMFHFKHSLRPFIMVKDDFAWYFIDLTQNDIYLYSELASAGLCFYTDANNPDFLGVAVMGEIAY